MKKVVLLGDSIRMNYQDKAKEFLGEGYAVWGPAENCRFSTYTLNSLRFWEEEINSADLIHWNNGIWDAVHLYDEGVPFSPLDRYLEDMTRILRVLKKSGAKIIFAKTTALHDEIRPYPLRPIIEQYNAAILERFQGQIDAVNDLYSLTVSDMKNYILEDGCHLTELGKEACGRAVAAIVRSVAEAK